MPGRFHLSSEVSSAWWRFLSTFGLTPERFHRLPGWQQRLGKLAVGGVIAFLIAIFVNVLEAVKTAIKKELGEDFRFEWDSARVNPLLQDGDSGAVAVE